MRIQPTHTSTGRNASRKVVGLIRTRPPFVQPPITCESARTSPAAATIPIDSQKRETLWTPTCVAHHSRKPATPAASAVVRPRVASYSPYLRISPQRPRRPRGYGRSELEAPSVEPGRPELRPELGERRLEVVREQLLDHPHLAVVVERHVDVVAGDDVHRRPRTGRAAHGEADRADARGEQQE